MYLKFDHGGNLNFIMVDHGLYQSPSRLPMVDHGHPNLNMVDHGHVEFMMVDHGLLDLTMVLTNFITYHHGRPWSSSVFIMVDHGLLHLALFDHGQL